MKLAKSHVFFGTAIIVAAAAGACGGSVSQEPAEGSGGNGTGGASQASATTSASSTSSDVASVTTSATTTTTSTSGPAGGGGDPSGCAELAPISLNQGKIVWDESMDGVWTPGESAAVQVTMLNTSNNAIQYPGLTIKSDNALVATRNPYNALFVLDGNQSADLDVKYLADPAVSPGTTVTFTATLHSINDVSCDALLKYSFEALIE